jgi:predicted Zn-dependent peptidase
MYKKTTLPNGLRIITQKLKSTKAVTVLVLAGAGSRYETKKINGISHFLEHMFFKGAKKYKNTKKVSEAIDSVGGDFNAFTGKEYAGYYVKTAGENVKIALDVLSDMLIHARFATKEIEKERGVILEEYNMYQDTPMYQIGWNFERLIIGDQPLGWDQIGTPKLIKSVTHDDFKKYQQKLYTPDNVVISITGDIDEKKIISMAKKYFKFDDEKKDYDFKAYKEMDEKETVSLQEKKTEQAHVIVGVKSYQETHKDHWAEKVLGVILGGNMSSRMFLNVREKQGLAYYIHTSSENFTDIGILSTNAGVDLKRIDKAIKSIIQEYDKVAAKKIDTKELNKAKNFLKGKIVLRLEDSEEYAHLLGKYELLHNKKISPKDIMEKIDKVKEDDVFRVAKNLLKPERMKVAVIGPYSEKKQFEKLL